MDGIAARVDQAAEAGGDAAVDFLRRLIRLQAGGEAAVQADVAAALEQLGCRVERRRYQPAGIVLRDEFAAEAAIAAEEREAVLARFPGSGDGRSVIFFAHPDGEPFNPQHGWRHDPMAGEIDAGRIHGWGVADDLAGVATMVEALRAVRAAGLTPKGDVILASTPSKRHARGVHALLHGGVAADAAVYLHPAESGVGMREVKALASGQLVFRILVKGRLPATNEPGHAAFAHTAINPIDKAMAVLAALRALDAARGARVHHPALDAAIGRSTNLLVGDVKTLGDGRAARVPPAVQLSCALSFPPGEKLAAVQAEVEAALAAAVAADADLMLETSFLSGVTGAEVPLDHPLWLATSEAVQRGTGTAPEINPLHTSSDIRNPMVQSGIPCVGLGPLCGDLTQNGGRDEWVDVADYKRGVAVVAALIALWCGAD
ncbi:M20 family metallopeptidase [Falsiroseomonas selenitidurans]|uniref:M20/M25/M40 family metallo-hydrolase n=1 Tax=Falsiroseomonas selenitidurans TaxID=2716335 RepID=A0ABX1E298_9PROT|nr:M20/M25/M40 family metallo-hydrolase [Falsiroseomonas selenitidurans]NKC30825.1 M20/M25/M40 family metallo-hydrolase [Falsiroseomonas selenitidurans]